MNRQKDEYERLRERNELRQKLREEDGYYSGSSSELITPANVDEHGDVLQSARQEYA